MKRVLCAATAVLFLALWAGPLHAESDAALGERLTRELWTALQAKDWAKVDPMLGKGYQSIHQDGPRGRAQEIKLLHKLELGEFFLKNFQVTRNGPVIVATYTASVPETIDGQRSNSTPAPRMTIWLKTDAGWKWQAHANLKPLKCKK